MNILNFLKYEYLLKYKASRYINSTLDISRKISDKIFVIISDNYKEFT